MRLLTCFLSLAVTLYPSAPYGFPESVAWADTATSTGTSTSTSSSTSTATSGCTNNRGTYQGFSDSNCYAYDTNNAANSQQNAQNNTKDTNDKGAGQSSMMGMMAIAGGMAMMAAGAAMMASPPTAGAGAALMAAGAMLMMAGMQAMSAAQNMDKNANTAGGYSADLGAYPNMPAIPGIDPISTNTSLGLNDKYDTGVSGSPTDTSVSTRPTELTGSPLGGATGGSNSVKIDPSALGGNEKANNVLNDFENKTGISRGELANTLNSGGNPADLLANSAKMKGLGVGADKINGALADAQASGNLPDGGAILDQLGMTQGDIAALAAANAAAQKANGSLGAGDAIAGGGGSRSPASASTPDYSFNPNANAAVAVGGASLAGSGGGSGGLNSNLSRDVQSALDRKGVTNRSLFQMVSEQYKRRTPMFFGAQTRKAASQADNPFADLGKDGVSL